MDGQTMTDKQQDTKPKAQAVCTCPSGDGSLRWPCPSHPASHDAQQSCYQCDKPCNWLAPDSRCSECTRCTPDEVTGNDKEETE